MGRMQQHILKLYDFLWQLGSKHTISFCTKTGNNIGVELTNRKTWLKLCLTHIQIPLQQKIIRISKSEFQKFCHDLYYTSPIKSQ